jgi:hypothetical protein
MVVCLACDLSIIPGLTLTGTAVARAGAVGSFPNGGRRAISVPRKRLWPPTSMPITTTI